MGVDTTQYRSRIGSFPPYFCAQQRKTTKYAKTSDTFNCDFVTRSNNLLPLYVIGLLLLISGIEINPGPGNDKKGTGAEFKDYQANRGNYSEDGNSTLDTSSDIRYRGNNPTLDNSSSVSDDKHGNSDSTLDVCSIESQIDVEHLEENVQSSIRDFLSLPQGQSMEVVPNSSDGNDKVVIMQNRSENILNLSMHFNDTKGPIQLGKSNQVYDIKTDRKKDTDTHSRSCIMQHLIDRTKEEINNQKMLWVDRAGFSELIRCLRTSKMAVLTGICGEGKTRIAMRLMQLIIKDRLPGFTDKIPIKINDPSEWIHAVRSGKNVLLFIDDIFGSTNLNETLLRQWEQKLNEIGPDVERGQIMLIVSSRKHIFNEALTLLKYSAYSSITTSLFSEQRHIDLSGTYQLSLKEKHYFVEETIKQQTTYDLKICGHQKEENILQCHSLENETVYIAEETIGKILQTKTSLGFPYLCTLFFSTKELISKGVSFFTKTNDYLEKEINTMFCWDKVKYFTLVYTLLNNNTNALYMESKKLNSFERSESDEKTQRKISQACGLADCSVQSIKDAAECLNGVFFKYNRSTHSYTFSHQSILETVSLHFGMKYPDVLLKHCSFRFLEQFVSIENPDVARDKPEILVSKAYFGTLSDVMYGYLLKSVDPESQINNRIMKNEAFVFYFFDYLDKNKLTKHVLEKQYPCYSRCMCTNLKHIFKHTIAVYATGNETFLGKLIEKGILDTPQLQLNDYCFLECSEKAVKYCDCYMFNAFKHGNIVCIELLLKSGICLPEQSLCLAASGNGELLKFIFQRKNWSRKEIKFALDRSCAMGTIQNIKFLAEQAVNLDIDSFYLAVDSGNVETVEFVLHQAQPMDVDKSIALYKACIDRNFQVLKFLAEKNVYFGSHLLEVAAKYSKGKTDILHYVYISKKWTSEQKTKALNQSCKFGSTSALLYLLKKGSVCDDFTLHIATRSGYISIVKTVFHKYKWSIESMNNSMNAACKRGYLDIIEYFINNNLLFNENSLNFVIQSGNIELLQYVLYNQNKKWTRNQINDAMKEACKKCSFPLVKCLNDFGAKYTEEIFPFISTNANLFKFILGDSNWTKAQLEKALKEACRNSDIEIVKYLKIEKRLSYSEDCLDLATESGNLRKLKYVFASGKWSDFCLTKSFTTACKKGLLDIIKFFHQKGCTCSLECIQLDVFSLDLVVIQFLLTNFKWTNDQKTKVMETACGTGELEIVRYLHLEHINYGQNGLTYAAAAREEFVDYIYSTGTWTVMQINKAIEEAEKRGNHTTVDYLKRKLFSRI